LFNKFVVHEGGVVPYLLYFLYFYRSEVMRVGKFG